jgi:hypothetical protein
VPPVVVVVVVLSTVDSEPSLASLMVKDDFEVCFVKVDVLLLNA